MSLDRAFNSMFPPLDMSLPLPEEQVVVGDETPPAVQEVPRFAETDLSGLPLKVLQWPDSRLSQVSEPVTPEEVPTQEFVDNVRKLSVTLARLGGYGLAAPQVGWMKRVIAMVHPQQLAEIGARSDRAEGTWRLDIVVLVNPVIVETRGGMTSRNEGCLSFDGAGVVSVPSYEDVDVECPDVGIFAGIPFHTGKLRYISLAARCVSHEIDHLEGRSMLDRMGKTQRHLFMKELRKAQQKRARAS